MIFLNFLFILTCFFQDLYCCPFFRNFLVLSLLVFFRIFFLFSLLVFSGSLFVILTCFFSGFFCYPNLFFSGFFCHPYLFYSGYFVLFARAPVRVFLIYLIKKNSFIFLILFIFYFFIFKYFSTALSNRSYSLHFATDPFYNSIRRLKY